MLNPPLAAEPPLAWPALPVCASPPFPPLPKKPPSPPVPPVASPLTLAPLGRRALAKDSGVGVEGSGSSRIVLGGDIGTFTDPDGFVWETSS